MLPPATDPRQPKSFSRRGAQQNFASDPILCIADQ
jgi:hypothetical protein